MGARSTSARRRGLAGLLAALIVASAAQAAEGDPPPVGFVVRAVPEQTDWLVRVPVSDKLRFRGLGNGDADLQAGYAMMYPGGTLPMFLASVIAHGLVSSSMQSSREAGVQAEADRVLAPYQPTLDLIAQRPVLQQALSQLKRAGTRQLLGENAAPEGTWVLDVAPVFALTQDERALVLDSVVAVFAPEAPQKALYRSVVRIVSHPRPEQAQPEDRRKLWTADEGRMLKEESATLLAEGLELVLAELAAGPGGVEGTHRTVRYPIGGREQMERAALVAERCDRLVLKTLRGGLMSVPRRDYALSSSCDMKPAAPAAPAASPVQTASP